MRKTTFRSLLISGSALLGLGLGLPAHAIIVEPNPADFRIIDNGNSFTIINNSANWWIEGFQATVNATGPGITDSTTQPGWVSNGFDTCGSCTGNDTFTYTNSDPVSDLADDVGPGSASNGFFFTPDPPISSAIFTLTDPNGDVFTVHPTGVPEPASWAMMILGLGLIGAGIRLRPARSVGRATGAIL